MPTEIDSLQIKIESQSSAASKNIDELIGSLSKLKDVPVVNTLGKNLKKLSESLESFNASSSSMSKISELAKALQPLQGLKMPNLNSLKKLPEITKSLDDTVIADFAASCNKLAQALEPLAMQTQRMGAVWKTLPGVAVRTTSAINGYSKAASHATGITGKLNAFLSSMKARFAGITFIVSKVVSVVGGWVTETNNYVENVNLFTVAMGEYAEEAMEYAEAVSDAMGVDVSEFIRNQGIFMSMAKGFGLVNEQAYKMSKGLTELSYDLSSFYNISLDAVGDGAFAKVQSGIAGELEPLRRLGFALSEASLQQVAYSHGIKLSIREMTEAQKATLRYTAMVEQAADMGVIGDMSRTLIAPANAMRILQSQLTQLTRALGSLFIPILIKVIPYVQAFFEVLTGAVQKLAQLMGFTLPTIDYSGLDGVSSSAAESLDEAADSAKKLKSQMMGIDELNVISQDTDTGVEANGFASDLGLDIDSIWDESMLEGIGTQVDEIKKKIEPVLELALGVATAFAAWKIGKGVFSAINNVKTALWGMTSAGAMDELALLFDKKLVKGLSAFKGMIGSTSIGGMIMGTGSTSMVAVAGAIAAVVAAVAFLIGGLIDVYNKSENFRNGLSVIFDFVGDIVSGIGDFFGGIGTFFADLVPQGVLDFFEKFDASIGDLLIAAGGLLLFGPVGLAIEGAVLAIKGIGYAASDSLKPVEIFTDEISTATREKVEPFLTKMDELEQTFNTIDWGNIEITMTDVENIKAQLSEIVTTITDELDADKNEALATIDPLKGAMDAESYEALVAKVNESYTKQAAEVEAGAARINEIIATAEAENRTITDTEAQEIAKIREGMKNTGIKYLSESETESNLILNRLKDSAGQITALQAAEQIKNAISARDKTIAAANEQYEGIALEAQRMLDTNTINKEEYDKIIAAAEATRDETIAAANTQYDTIVTTAQEKMGEYSKYVDTETGEIKSKWEVFCDDTAQFFTDWWTDIQTNWNTWLDEQKTMWTEFGATMKQGFTDAWTAVSDWFNNDVKPWFTKEKWAGIFSGIKEGLATTLTNAINSGVDKLNEFIGWINDKMSFTIPGFEIFEGKSFDYPGIPGVFEGGSIDIPGIGWSAKDVTLLSLPTISRFADGGFIEDGLFTMNRGEIAGKFNNGKSVVANNEQIIAGISEGVYSAVMAAMSNSKGSDGEQNINVYLDGKQIYSAVKKTESERGKQIFGNQLSYGY